MIGDPWFYVFELLIMFCFHGNGLRNKSNLRKPGVGTTPYSYRMTSRVPMFHSVHDHRQHCTLQAFEQFGALYRHNPDDKHLTLPGFEPSTLEIQPDGTSHRGRPYVLVQRTAMANCTNGLSARNHSRIILYIIDKHFIGTVKCTIIIICHCNWHSDTSVIF